MESEGPLSLTKQQWNEIEKLSELLSQTADLQEALQTGLSLLLATLGRTGAAFFFPRLCEHVTRDWTLECPPVAWKQTLLSARSPLLELARQVMESGQVTPGVEALELGTVLPVRLSTRVFGALLVAGDPIPPGDIPVWLAFLRPFAQAAALHAVMSGNTSGVPSYLELMRSRNTLRAMFDSLPISIYIIDSAYNLAAINFSRSGRVNEKPNQLVGRKCYQSLYHRSEACSACRVGETFATAQNTVRVSRTWLENDRFEEWEISTFPIMDENNQVFQTIVIEQDVTEKRNLEANLIQSEKLAAVGQLAAGIAHEINNPLTAIIANAQILRQEISPQDQDLQDSVKLIEMASTRASQVVRNLLGIARKEKYEFEPIDLNETIYNALSLVQHELVGKPIKVQMNLAENLPHVLASHDQLQGVWINLILNAIDALDKEESQISISSCYEKGEFMVTVADNGKGIPLDHLPRIFEPFFTTKTPGRGTGLGLSVCMRVIRHHGGNLRVESQLNKWTRFIVTLPDQE